MADLVARQDKIFNVWTKQRDYVILRKNDYLDYKKYAKFDENFNNRFIEIRQKALNQVQNKRGMALINRFNNFMNNFNQGNIGNESPAQMMFELSSGEAQNDIMGIIARALDRHIQNCDKNRVDTFNTSQDSIRSSLQNNGKLITNQKALQNCLDDVTKAINVINKHQIDSKTLENIWLHKASVPITLSTEEVEVINQVTDILNKARDKISTSMQGAKTSSIKSIVNEIFTGPLGENLAGTIVMNAIQNGAFNMIKDIKVQSGIIPVNTGELYTVNKTRSKVDIVISGILQITYFIDSQELTITTDSNLSVKWYSSNKSNSFPNIKIVETTMKKCLSNLAHKELIPIIRNGLIKHGIRDPYIDKGGRNIIKNYLTASFINDWVSGSGDLIENTTAYDKAQFLFINGRIFSTKEIIALILNKMGYDSNSVARLINLNFDGLNGIENKEEKKQPGEESNELAAFRRTNAINSALSTVKLYGYISGRAFKELLKTY